MDFRKNILYFSLFCLTFLSANAQEGLPIYSDYLTDNYYLLYPSMAGVSNCGKVRVTGRQQWFDHEKAPQCLHGNLEYHLKAKLRLYFN